MAINAFFLDLRMANRSNFSLNQPFLILEAARDTCTNTARRYLLPLVVAVGCSKSTCHFPKTINFAPLNYLLMLRTKGVFNLIRFVPLPRTAQ